jgi:hypothetical protein
MGPRAGLHEWGRDNLLPIAGIELRFLGHPAHSLVAIPSEILELPTYNIHTYILYKAEFELHQFPQERLTVRKTVSMTHELDLIYICTFNLKYSSLARAFTEIG